MSEENWADIIGYEGFYQISNYGNVKSLVGWRGNKYFNRTKILKKTISTTGYYKIKLCYQNKRKDYKVHRLVASAFISPVYGKYYVNHKDGNRKNNYFENLEWCTQQENVAHAIKTGLKKTFKISKEELEELYIKQNLKPKEIAVIFGTTCNVIRQNALKYGLKKSRYNAKRIYEMPLDDLILDIKSGLKNKEIAKKYSCTTTLVATRKYKFKKEGLL